MKYNDNILNLNFNEIVQLCKSNNITIDELNNLCNIEEKNHIFIMALQSVHNDIILE